MLARKRGGVLNVASTSAFQPGPLMAVYYASKAFVLSFSEALGEEAQGTASRELPVRRSDDEPVPRARRHRQDAARVARSTPMTIRQGSSGNREGYTAADPSSNQRVVITGARNRIAIAARGSRSFHAAASSISRTG